MKKYEKSDEEKAQLGKEDAGRFDEGKTRHDLIPAWATEQLALVYTYGCQKYDDNNWWKGMRWSKVIGPMKRHVEKWLRGEQNDDESGLHHLAHVAWNAITLMEYERNNLGTDDRVPFNFDLMDSALRQKKIDLWLKCHQNGKADDYNGLDVRE
jgi:hypothetical protein